MLMIKFYVNQKGQKMTLTGHAGAAPRGKDLVCAAASMLACTLAQTVLQLHREGTLGTMPKVLLTPGCAHIEVMEGCKAAETAFFTIRTGCSLLAGRYPKYVRLETEGEEG